MKTKIKYFDSQIYFKKQKFICQVFMIVFGFVKKLIKDLDI